MFQQTNQTPCVTCGPNNEIYTQVGTTVSLAGEGIETKSVNVGELETVFKDKTYSQLAGCTDLRTIYRQRLNVFHGC